MGWRVEPEGSKPDRRFSAPAVAKREDAVEPMRGVEMHAVAVREFKRREPADRLTAPGALPMRQALAVLHVPVVLDLTPRNPRRLAGGVKSAPIRQPFAISGAPVGDRAIG